MGKTITSLLSVLGLLNLVSLGCGPKPSQQSQRCSGMGEVAAVLRLLETSPDPALLEKADRAERRAVVVALRRIAKRDLHVIREAMWRYARERDLDFMKHDDPELTRLFVLNAYLFNCPEKAPANAAFFPGWGGIPYDGEYVNPMWPLSYDAQGRIVLTGRFRGPYFGPSYAALRAFDCYREKYGRRPRSVGHGQQPK